MRYTMGLRLSSLELESLRPLEENCSKHISIVNDIYSYEKELIASKTGHKEGACLCTAVKVVADETSLGIQATKRVLWSMVREWEFVHDQMVADLLSAAPASTVANLQRYVDGLRYQMSGNELWSKTTPRYTDHHTE